MNKLKYVEGRIICSIDLQAKNWHTFSSGLKIRRERQYNELNRRLTEPVNAIIISAKDIPEGSEILIHHNCVHDVNRVFNYKQFGGSEIASDVKIFSVREEDCFLWKDKNGEWRSMNGFETALRVFKPYTGILHGIDPTQLKDTLFVTSGELKGQVVGTVKAADYQIIFQDSNGQEGNVIRFRPYGDDKRERESEAIAILNKETKMVHNGELLIGLTKSDAKQLHTSQKLFSAIK